MTGIENLKVLLASMKPELHEEKFIFCSFPNTFLKETFYLEPIASFQEKEGLSLIITKDIAEKNNIHFKSVFRLISLTIHSSLEAVGLTAAIAQKLAAKNISANVVAAYYHDHIFVPEKDIVRAMEALTELQKENS